MQGFKDDFDPEDVSLREETIKLLLDAKANPNVSNTSTLMTCLHWACYYPKDLLSVKRLLEAGANIFAFEAQGLSALDIAGLSTFRFRKNTPKLLSLLLEYAEKEVDKHINAMNKCSQNNININIDININTETTSELPLKVKTTLFEYSEHNKYYLDALYWAAYFDRTKLVKKIISLGISPFVQFYRDESAVVGAIKGGALNTVKLLFKIKYEAESQSGEAIKMIGILYLFDYYVYRVKCVR